MTRRRGGGPLVVVGDAFLDIDLDGTSERLAPDAPVPVVQGVTEHVRAGGAGLAATLAADLEPGAVVLVAPVAGDGHAARLRAALPGLVRLVPLPARGETVRKVRVRAGGRPVVRIDHGDARAAPGPLPDEAAEVLASAGAVLVSDYGRGTTALPALRKRLRELARTTPVVWDPHPAGAPPVPGTRVAVPNHREARAFAAALPDAAESAGRPAGELDRAAADAAALVAAWEAAGVAVTMGERGALLSVGEDVARLVPVPPPDPAAVPAGRAPDPCGAGDCFAAAAALALRDGALLDDAVAAGVERASVFVATGAAAARRGAAADAFDVVRRVRERGGTVVATGGCFDLLHAGHVELLRQARALGDCLVVCLNSDASVRSLKGADRPLVAQEDRVRVLSALDSVDTVVIFEEETPVETIERLRPDLWVKGGDYAAADLPETAVVNRLGGETVLLPYLAGRSTTRIVERAAVRSARRRTEEGA
ncbi:D-glycero-beta-D-manno-heptose 1-phosphate adenylyltransferase [Actinomadura atramentaria]|uniref:D-glycero-beta-D-manno-heptose 1-phosphate adenylyltransferase n=1 Tax=Actinomadura atramentaria TaxID=1990 RepID=UPI00037B2322|nr:D-glycero-beta-D-manno-heptose 1-phosphate adenylyltransferase [Actinomadura atramentaria]